MLTTYNYMGGGYINKSFPPNVNPEIFSILATVVGFVIEDDYTANELNSIGNWLILVGQFMLTTSAQQQLINARYQNNLGSKIKSDANNHQQFNKEKANKEDLNALLKYVKDLEKELSKLKNDNKKNNQ